MRFGLNLKSSGVFSSVCLVALTAGIYSTGMSSVACGPAVSIGTPSPSPTPGENATPTPVQTAEPTPEPTAEPTATPAATPTATPTPVPACNMDGMKNLMESGVDCGKACSAACGVDQTCTSPDDCASRICPNTGICGCKVGELRCGVAPALGACINTLTDRTNCGACGVACTVGQVCSSGKCAAACAAGLKDCLGVCVQLGDDVNNCGACGVKCGAFETCSGGVCAKPNGSAAGCADGTRDSFTNQTTFPDIAGCAGGWSLPGIFPAPERSKDVACATNGDDSLTSPKGVGCASVDLCATGWHICKGGEVSSRTGGQGCLAGSYGPNEFYAASSSGTGCGHCASPEKTSVDPALCTSVGCGTNCRQRLDLNNDFFGCGTGGLASGSCEFNRFSNDQCNALSVGGWSCPDSVSESTKVIKNDSTGGGVMCCRD